MGRKMAVGNHWLSESLHAPNDTFIVVKFCLIFCACEYQVDLN